MLVAPGACSVGKLQCLQRYSIALPSTIAAKLTGVLWRRDLRHHVTNFRSSTDFRSFKDIHQSSVHPRTFIKLLSIEPSSVHGFPSNVCWIGVLHLVVLPSCYLCSAILCPTFYCLVFCRLVISSDIHSSSFIPIDTSYSLNHMLCWNFVVSSLYCYKILGHGTTSCLQMMRALPLSQSPSINYEVTHNPLSRFL